MDLKRAGDILLRDFCRGIKKFTVGALAYASNDQADINVSEFIGNLLQQIRDPGTNWYFEYVYVTGKKTCYFKEFTNFEFDY